MPCRPRAWGFTCPAYDIGVTAFPTVLMKTQRLRGSSDSPRTTQASLRAVVQIHLLTRVPMPCPLGFLIKCIQLYETTVVRHGLMLVGPTGSGKSNVSRAKHGRGGGGHAPPTRASASTRTPLASGLPSPPPVVPQPTASLLSEKPGGSLSGGDSPVLQSPSSCHDIAEREAIHQWWRV